MPPRPPEPPAAAAAAEVARKEEKAGKRTPKAVTCVAFGDLQVRSAADPERPAADRERAREEARKAYQQALKIDPKCRAAHLGLVNVYKSADDVPRAVAAYQKVLTVYPKDAPLWCDLGVYQGQKKDWVAAAESLRKAVELDPENREYARNLGFFLAFSGRHDESLIFFRKVVGEAKAHYNLACVHDYQKQPEQAKFHLQLALRADPQLPEAHKMLARLDGGAAAGQEVVPVGYEAPQPEMPAAEATVSPGNADPQPPVQDDPRPQEDGA